MVVLRFISVPSCCRRVRSSLRIVASVGWILCLIGLLTVFLSHVNLDHWYRSVMSLSESELMDRDRLMSEIGFVPNPLLYPHSHHQTEDLPVFIAAIHSEDLHSFHRFLGSFRLHFRQRKLVVYDLGLTPKELKLVRHTCQCLVRAVHWDRYPPHVRDATLKAYRPILIQETLREFGIVFWCHHEMRFNGSDIEQLRARAEAVGLVAWPSQRHPTSTYTHDGMLERFDVERRNLYFQHMAEPDTAIYVNTFRLHNRLMKPWVRCALDANCLAPLGARPDSCDMTRQPRYRYAGCHRYDTSAFNVLLGKMFYFDDTTYIPSSVVFYRETVLPPIRHPRLATDLPLDKSKRRSGAGSAQWEVQDQSADRRPILFKRKPPTT